MKVKEQKKLFQQAREIEIAEKLKSDLDKIKNAN